MWLITGNKSLSVVTRLTHGVVIELVHRLFAEFEFLALFFSCGIFKTSSFSLLAASFLLMWEIIGRWDV